MQRDAEPLVFDEDAGHAPEGQRRSRGNGLHRGGRRRRVRVRERAERTVNLEPVKSREHRVADVAGAQSHVREPAATHDSHRHTTTPRQPRDEIPPPLVQGHGPSDPD